MKKGIIGLMTACMLFNLAVIGDGQKVEAAGGYTKASSIKVGDTVVLVCESAKMELDSISTTNTKYGIGVKYVEEPSGVFPLTVAEGNSAGSYALKNSDGLYLYWTSGNSLATNASLSANTSWTIKFDADGNAAMKNVKDSARQVWWNVSSPRFASYTGKSAGTDYYAIQLYKLETGESEDPVDKTPTEEVNALLSGYYNNGNYLRHTEINLNEKAKNELAKYWHACSDLLERDTYFVGEELWMTNEKGTYSYYGTDGADMVSARTENPLYQPKSTHVAIKGKTMEQYYTTMDDIKNNTAEWTKNGNVYSTNDETVVKMFLDFTAPCLYDITADNANYLSYNGVEVEKTDEGLELRLKATTLETGKLAVENGVLSTATITKESNQVTITNVADALNAENDTPVSLEGIVAAYHSNGTNSFFLEDLNGNSILVYGPKSKVNLNDKVLVEGSKTTYSGNTQVASGSTVTVLEEGEYNPTTFEVTVEEAIEFASELKVNYSSRDLYTITGSVNIIDSKYYLVDGENSIQLYGSYSGLHQGCTVTVTGNLCNFKGTNEVVSYTIDEVVPATYSIEVECGENGSYEISSTTAKYNTAVTIEVTPNDGYVVDSVKANGITILEASENSYVYTVTTDTTIEILFVEESQGSQPSEPVTITRSVSNLITEYGWTDSTTKQSFNLDSVVSVKIDGGSNTGKAYDGNHIRIYATDTPAGTVTISLAEGYKLQSIKISTQTGTYAFLYVDGTTTDICNKVTSVSGNSVKLNSVKNGSNGKQVRITEFEVTYIKA